MRTVTLVGGANTTSDQWRMVPADEVFALSYLGWKRNVKADRFFEMHRLEDIPSERLARLKTRTATPTYMLKEYAEYPTSVAYPITAIERRYANPVFTSSLDYMIALALWLKYERIQVMGFELDKTGEYFYQRPGAYYWFGVCDGLGVEVNVTSMQLLRDKRYGYEGYPRIDPDFMKRQELIRDQLVW